MSNNYDDKDERECPGCGKPQGQWKDEGVVAEGGEGCCSVECAKKLEPMRAHQHRPVKLRLLA